MQIADECWLLFTQINILGSVGNESGKRAQGFGALIRNHTSEQCLPAQIKDFSTSDESVKIGDLIYYRAEDSDHKEDVPQWMVVTQGPHKRCDCVSRNFHSKVSVLHKKCVTDPTYVTVAPALGDIAQLQRHVPK